jgi:hypothetical protein
MALAMAAQMVDRTASQTADPLGSMTAVR